jgi:hypothetical protein
MAKKSYSEVNFTNSIGQVIQPGDRVITIASGYAHNISVREGIFLGASPGGYPTCQVTSTGGGWVDAQGNPCKYNAQASYERNLKSTRRSTLQLGRVYKIA